MAEEKDKEHGFLEGIGVKLKKKSVEKLKKYLNYNEIAELVKKSQISGRKKEHKIPRLKGQFDSVIEAAKKETFIASPENRVIRALSDGYATSLNRIIRLSGKALSKRDVLKFLAGKKEIEKKCTFCSNPEVWLDMNADKCPECGNIVFNPLHRPTDYRLKKEHKKKLEEVLLRKGKMRSMLEEWLLEYAESSEDIAIKDRWVSKLRFRIGSRGEEKEEEDED